MFRRLLSLFNRTRDSLEDRESSDVPAESAPSGIAPDWQAALHRDVGFYSALPRPRRRRLEALIQQFIDEKEFWGPQNHVLTDEMKVYVAAHACLMVLALPRLGLFPNAREVILYPSHFGETVETIAPDGRVFVVQDRYLGQAWRRGPVLLAWDAIAPRSGGMFIGHNTIYHEFAHVLDMQDGDANGAPKLENPEAYADWRRVMTREFESLRAAAQTGRPTFIDPYGAQDPAEFFAVISEHFFTQPRRLERLHRGLYQQLKGFYRQDPARWMN